MEIDKKEIQKKRMMGYFIEATNKIIADEGVEGVTIRKVADLAGYNSATLYNYFDNLDHLIFFASMKFLKDYASDLPKYIKEANNPLDRYLKIWECFCIHSFNHPKIYYTIFFAKYSDSINDAVKDYYSIFPEELGDENEDMLPMLLERSIFARDLAALEECSKVGILKWEDLKAINEMIILLYQGMLMRVLTKEGALSLEEVLEKTLKYIRKIIEAYKVD